jgi:hypothetical protein
MREPTGMRWFSWMQLPNRTSEPLSLLTERALYMLLLLAVLGIILLLIATLSLPSLRDGIRFASIGLISALASGALGLSLGLLFGLPTLAARAASLSNANSNSTTPNSPPLSTSRAQPLYGDNTSIEQVADWLTKIIIGLGLTQFDAFTERFDATARMVSAAMLGVAEEKANPVFGGALLLGAFLLCFLASYLWSRRYLPIELAGARVDQLAAEERHIQRTEVMRTQQQKLEADQSVDNLYVAAQAMCAAAHVEGFPDAIAPNKSADPWKGQFGGQARRNEVELAALLNPMHIRDGYVAVDLRLRGVSAPARARLAGKTARLYLHPSFPDPLRMVVLDAMGEVRLPLIVWGAFTVGAQLDDGTLLELDLAQLANAPPAFQLSA